MQHRPGQRPSRHARDLRACEASIATAGVGTAGGRGCRGRVGAPGSSMTPLMYCSGRSKFAIVSQRSCGIDSGTGMSLSVFCCSVVLMVSSSCRGRGEGGWKRWDGAAVASALNWRGHGRQCSARPLQGPWWCLGSGSAASRGQSRLASRPPCPDPPLRGHAPPRAGTDRGLGGGRWGEADQSGYRTHRDSLDRRFLVKYQLLLGADQR